MRVRRVTIHDVAVEAGVSITTVSHSLNNKGTISEATRRRVVETALAMGYEADALARGLRSSKIGAIGLVLRPLDTLGTYRPEGVDYFMRLVGAAAVSALDRGLSLMPVRDLTEGRNPPLALSLDGYIVGDPIENDPVIDILLERDIPVVGIGRDVGRPDFRDWVGAEEAHDTERVLDLLWGKGARRIVLVRGTDANSWNIDTTEAYRAWTRKRGIPCVIESQPEAAGAEGGRNAAERLFSGPVAPDAAYCLTGRHASGLVAELQRRDIDVPADVQVVAGSDSEQSRDSVPPITALDLVPEEIAQAAVELLADRLEGSKLQAPMSVAPRLILRGSTR
ncbi:LacI family DNA-binding transcriptional regulator [Saxibacter everestensis]|uniref:LacI family DNA-binding transcriptional regulator n=1 Tax=Saxibacter everestensis TaxID=2909229 RepID=A0ABY8QR62_9MICO|nr:LacI family DNA-binding transcriptional regulator [Brevibacteriaceae bacterium ZFBP1038]